MRNRLARFMYGRYGSDDFCRFLLIAMFVCVILNMFIPTSIFYYIALVLLVYSYYRMFSKDINKRTQENQMYLRYKTRFTGYFSSRRKMMGYRKTHRIYSCPECRQKIKVPKGKGKIMITCPRCRTQFQKKS